MKPEKLKKYYVKTYTELYKLIDQRMRTASIPPPPRTRDKLAKLKNALLVKLGVTYNTVEAELEKLIELLNTIAQMHSFYIELFMMKTGKHPEELVKKFKIYRRIARKIYNEYRQAIKTSLTGRDTVRYFKAGIGRLLSIYRRNSAIIQLIKEAVIEISKLPDITGDLVVIIAGMPQVGKSTLIRKLTNAKPEISPFPFTTKTIIAGHINMDPYGKIVLIDTPGLLDRPLEEKNPIEYKAVLALKHLSDIVLYMFDINPNSYYTIDQQLNVYSSIKKLLGDKEIIPIVNKIDITPNNLLFERINYLEKIIGKKPLPISAEKGINLEKLRKILIDKLMEKNQPP